MNLVLEDKNQKSYITNYNNNKKETLVIVEWFVYDNLEEIDFGVYAADYLGTNMMSDHEVGLKFYVNDNLARRFNLPALSLMYYMQNKFFINLSALISQMNDLRLVGTDKELLEWIKYYIKQKF